MVKKGDDKKTYVKKLFLVKNDSECDTDTDFENQAEKKHKWSIIKNKLDNSKTNISGNNGFLKGGYYESLE
ncbi:MAG: hypothetical protein R6V04_04130 [bacterium]